METASITLESPIQNFEFEMYNPQTDKSDKKMFSDYEGKRTILVFYPADFTFVCPTELKDLSKIYSKILEINVEIFVVSTDTIFSHKRRIETESLLKDFKIPMISDRTGEITKYFNIRNEKTGNAERGTFIISPKGILKSIEISTESVGRSAQELLRKMEALHFIEENPGHACPASRNIGLKSLKPGLDIAGKVGETLE
ncbi:alkyl hydroperoxide reductase [candidate division SR1 bacterium RAAC1_SR1_1]|nr:alkyl hydroperoxide reductase [candidate division SR1 bacterium RAAC1_SR1_1]